MMDIEELKDNIYRTVLAFYEGSENKTADFIKEKLDSVCKGFSSMGVVIDEDLHTEIRNKLLQNLSVDMNGEEAYISDEAEYEPWLDSHRGNIDWKYWNRYKAYLKKSKKWSPKVVDSLDQSSNKILDLMGNPISANSFMRRGLVMGDVQSGKTATYTAIANKAADAGYKVIIILTGMQEDLRKQTQKRLDEEFAGRNSFDELENKGKRGRRKKVGVANYCDESFKPMQLTSTNGDFSISTVKRVTLDIRSINEPALFVVKKQKNVLKNLAEWLQDSEDEKTGKIMQPLLMIDDEADNASVNTKEQDDPTTINKGIRKILNMFDKAAYVGVTATPFANIFIQPDVEDVPEQSNDENMKRMVAKDLFPSDFIYALDTPNNYVGAVKIFGEEDGNDGGSKQSMLMEINDDEMESVGLQYSHKKDVSVEKLPNELIKALYYFILVNAIRDFRKQKKTHRSMMIHVSRFTAVQKQIYELVYSWLSEIRSEIENYSKLPDSKIDKNDVLNDMKKIYEDMALEKAFGVDWQTIRKKYLFNAISPVAVVLQNSTSNESLDYDGYEKDGLRVIAVGGNSFSRGLTLEGLCVTFFYRRSMMYDTLLQMGRWFGYRPGYDDLCKVWLSRDAIGWYRYITDAVEELKDQIREMQRQRQKPAEFGLKVRRHPASLLVTARNKMKTAQSVTRAITLSRKYIETPRIKYDSNIIEANYQRISRFIKQLPEVYKGNEIKHSKLFWKNIPSAKVASFVSNFECSTWQFDFQSEPLAKYISEVMDKTQWDVLIPEGTGKEIKLCISDGKISLKKLDRDAIINNDIINLGGRRVRIATVNIAESGLSPQEIKKVKEEYTYINKKKNPPCKAYMIKGRNPLLVLFFIEPKDYEKKGLPSVITAIGLGFPDTGEKEVTVDYMVNLVEWNNTYGDYNDDEE